jgi:hypothetical protein
MAKWLLIYLFSPFPSLTFADLSKKGELARLSAIGIPGMSQLFYPFPLNGAGQ